MQTIELDDYNIHVGDIWKTLNSFLDISNYSKHIIIVDENTKRYCLPGFLEKTDLKEIEIIEIQSGEQHKNIHTCTFIWKKMIESNTDRKALVIPLGGGVIGDMGGFCAATYKRGLDFIQVPTTLLSNVDSSIGSKLGIDFAEIKNSIGLFKNPKAVFINPDFLKTLPDREIRSGFAEIIKHCLIADVDLWNEIKGIQKLEEVDWTALMIPSLKIKREVVNTDPFEQNIRKALNFGHTIGHAIESHALKSSMPLTHGESIAIGMICECYLSNQNNDLDSESTELISKFILNIYGKYSLKSEYFSELIRLMKNDKKNVGSKINFTILKEIGVAEINQTFEEELVIESLSYYANL